MKVILASLLFLGIASVLYKKVWRCFDILRKDARLSSTVQSYILITLWTLLIAMGVSILTGVIIIK